MKFANLLQSGVYILLALIQSILGLRFILKFFSANASNGFVDWVYETSQQVLEPFAGIFPAPQLEGGIVIEFSTLFAIFVYGLAGYLILALIEAVAPTGTRTKETKK